MASVRALPLSIRHVMEAGCRREGVVPIRMAKKASPADTTSRSSTGFITRFWGPLIKWHRCHSIPTGGTFRFKDEEQAKGDSDEPSPSPVHRLHWSIPRPQISVTGLSSMNTATFAKSGPNSKSTVVPFFRYTNWPLVRVNVSPPWIASLIQPSVT
jgi:hypothetical protein